jgi:glutathione S-transferase
MIILYGFAPAFGLPDPSPFVMKTEVQLKMAGVSYRKERAVPPDAPKGKMPFIDDDGIKVGDSTFIRAHIERTRNIDLDANLGPEQRALAWTVERMLEDHLYWAIMHLRWMDTVNFAKGPSHFFDGLPAGVRDRVRAERREHVRQSLIAHGLGRHTNEEIFELGAHSVRALAALLGDKPYLTGPKPCGADATLFGMVASLITPYFDSELQRLAQGYGNLGRYCASMLRTYYPEFVAAAG